MNLRFLKRSGMQGFAATLAGEAIGVGCSIASFVVLVLRLPSSSYGQYAGMLGITTAVGAVLWVALPLVVIEDTARGVTHAEVVRSQAETSLAFAYVFAVLLTIGFTRLLIPDPNLVIAVLMVSADLGLWWTQVIAGSRQATHGLRQAALIRTAAAVTRAIGLVVGSLISNRLIVVVIASCVFSWATALVVRVWIGGRFRPVLPDRGFLRRAVAYQAGVVSAAIQEETDKTFLLRYRGAVINGQYAAAFRLFQVLALPIRALSGSLQADFVNHQPDWRTAIARLHKFYRVSASYGLFAWAFLTSSGVVLTWFFPGRFGKSIWMFVVLGAILPVRAMVPLGTNMLVGLGGRRERALCQMLGCAVALILYVVLIPRYGAFGAALASLIAEIFVLAAISWFLYVIRVGHAPKHLLQPSPVLTSRGSGS